MSRGRAAFVNVFASLGMAALVSGGVVIAGGPTWAAWAAGAVTYLVEVQHPSPRVREGLERRP